MHSEDLKAIFSAAVASVKPAALIRKSITTSCRHLVICGKKYELQKPCYVVGFGKAVLGMGIELENLLKDKLAKGIISIPKGILGYAEDKPKCNSKIRFIEGAHNNLPDEDALKAANEIKKFVQNLDGDDVVIVLISGGGSALLPLPKTPIDLSEKLFLIKELGNRGADIKELNCVRKRISELKGGGLARAAYPAKVISLILSDVIGDPIDFIASGPTIPNNDLPEACAEVIKKYALHKKLPQSIKTVLDHPERYNNNFSHVDNYVIGNNTVATKTAENHAKTLAYESFILSTNLSGDVKEISAIYAELARELSKLTTNQAATTENLLVLLKTLKLPEMDVENITNKEYYGKRICVIGAGEPTVVVTGKGKGGRNQQLALSFSLDVNKFDIKSTNISFLSCGTDGIDGPTDAAGAIVTSDLINNALEQNINPHQFLENNDCYNFFINYNRGDDLIKIGHTGTNVMDIHLLIITPKM